MSLRMSAQKLASLRLKFSISKPRLKLLKFSYCRMRKTPKDISAFNAVTSEGVALVKKDKKNHAYIPSRISPSRRVSKSYKINPDRVDKSIRR